MQRADVGGDRDAASRHRSCGTGCLYVACVRHETLCNDGTDNGGDAQLDCQDSDCPNGTPCRRLNDTPGMCMNKTCL